MVESAGSGQARFVAETVLSRALKTILIVNSLIALSYSQHYRTIQINQWNVKLLENPAISLPSRSCTFFKGKVQGESNSMVILTECDKKLHVLVQVNDSNYAVDGDSLNLNKAHLLQRRHVAPSQTYIEDFFDSKLTSDGYTEFYNDDTVPFFDQSVFTEVQDDESLTNNNIDDYHDNNDQSLAYEKSNHKTLKDIDEGILKVPTETQSFLLNMYPLKDADKNLYSNIIYTDIILKKTIQQTLLQQNSSPETDNNYMYAEIPDAKVDVEGQKDYMNDLEINYNVPAASEINILQDGFNEMDNFDIEMLKGDETINLSEDVIDHTNNINYEKINPKSFFNGRNHFHDADKQMLKLELALIVDEFVVHFHGEDKLHRYILAMMNIVSVIMTDPSLGANMELIVKKLIKFKNKSNITLDLANKVNYKALMKSASQDGGGWDAAVFLTREEFGPSGFAYSGEICTKNKSTVLVYDYGLQSAFIVAHELGHLLGIKHDVQNNCGEDVNDSIMAEHVLSAFHKYHWSSCSRTDFQQNSEHWSCLRHHDKAYESSIRPRKSNIAHYAFSRDEQCRQTFGKGYIACKLGRESCTELLCASRINPFNCESNYSPLTGTRCGKNKWCTEGVCKPKMRFPSQPQWGTWGPWSPLARTNCGYQLMVRHRDCYADSSAVSPGLCDGNPSELNTVWTGKQCAEYQDLRTQMCQEKGHDLIPYEHENPQEHCNLWCIDAYEGDKWSFGKVRDGTPCAYSRPQDLCFNGECVAGACESLDYSCNWCPSGQCDNYTVTSAKTVNKTGWTSLLKIPKGAHKASLWIYFVHPIEIAVENGESSYVKLSVHSDLKRSTDRPLELRARHLKSSRRRLHRTNSNLKADGRNEGRLVVNGTLLTWTFSETSYIVKFEPLLQTELHIIASWNNRYFRQRPAPSVTYTLNYSVSVDTSISFEWGVGEWEECSATCGDDGVQMRQLFCVSSDTRLKSRKELINNMVSNFFCDSRKIPIKKRACNRSPCLGYWKKGALTSCSVTCGTGYSTEQLICSTDYCGKKPKERRVKCSASKRCQTRCKNSVDSALCTFYKGYDLKRFCDTKLFRKKCCLTCSRFFLSKLKTRQ